MCHVLVYLARCVVNYIYLFVVFIDDFGLLVPLEPHHVLGVKPPALFLERLRREVLRLRALHVVEHEEQRLRR